MTALSKIDQIRAKFVYVIVSPVAVKIGISASPAGRLAELSTASPFVLSLQYEAEANWYSTHAADVERRVHDSLADKRMNGEWFNVPADVAIAEIQKEITATREDHFACSDKHVLVSSVRETNPEIKQFWPLSLITWRTNGGSNGRLEALSETVLARLTLEDAKNMVTLLQEDIVAIEKENVDA